MPVGDLLPSVDPRAAEIIKTISDFETSVEAAEAALEARDWARVDALLAEQHRLTHALANGLDETSGQRPQSFTDEVNRRIRGISERRADHLRRLIAFNHLVKQRLTVISRGREMRRGNGPSTPAARILDTMQ
jgi:hypothetical protein